MSARYKDTKASLRLVETPPAEAPNVEGGEQLELQLSRTPEEVGQILDELGTDLAKLAEINRLWQEVIDGPDPMVKLRGLSATEITQALDEKRRRLREQA